MGTDPGDHTSKSGARTEGSKERRVHSQYCSRPIIEADRPQSSVSLGVLAAPVCRALWEAWFPETAWSLPRPSTSTSGRQARVVLGVIDVEGLAVLPYWRSVLHVERVYEVPHS